MGQAERTSPSDDFPIRVIECVFSWKVKNILPKGREHLARKERKSCPKPKGGKILLREKENHEKK